MEASAQLKIWLSKLFNNLFFEAVTPRRVYWINKKGRFKICNSTPWNFVQGGLIPEMIQVCDYDILVVLVELNTLI